ncbi:MAG: phosphate acetyltransferase [Bacteroidales bacterium]|nr:phosphate acetyltransferase [Bacteroidales bacterium]
MEFEKIVQKLAKQYKQRIVLPEGTEPRTIRAADIIIKEKIAEIVLIGNPDFIKDFAQKENLQHIQFATIIDPLNHDKIEEYARLVVEIRKNKGVDIDTARELIKKPLYLAATIIKAGDADGEVAGAENTTGNVLRPGFQLIKTLPGVSLVSSVFVIILKDKEFGDDGMMIFADCAVNPDPNEDELAEIAVTTARTAKKLLGMTPRIAMLSFSTHGSAQHKMIDKVAHATKIVQQNYPNLLIDGEMQLDAAIMPEVCAKKAPNAKIQGNANVLIFPTLEAGNIAYKLVQRFAHADVYGPIMQGLAAPINDLSRGCSVNDIVNVVAITAIQASQSKKSIDEF